MNIHWTHKKTWLAFAAVMVVGTGTLVAASFYSAQHYSCNTLVIDVKGGLVTSYATTPVMQDESGGYVTYSDQVAKIIEEVETSKTVKAIIVDVDSYGGLPVAGEEIADALKRTGKPNAALIRSAGLSSAYWAASGADRIFASRNSDVGSIGASMQLRNFVEKNKKEGIKVTSITSGQFKGIGDPNRELTDEEKKLLQNDVDKIQENFVKGISENRAMSLEAVEKLADGASMLGDKAFDKGLIDEIGGLAEVKKYLVSVIGEEVRVCSPPAPVEN